MDLSCIHSALSISLNYWTKLGFLVFFQILIQSLRPDIVDVEHRVRIVPTRDLLHSYDFVIIGAGSAGSVIANRLSENADWTILLLEAGGHPSVLTDVPALETILQQTEVDWQFRTEPMSTACLGMNNNQCNWPRGKALGGTSVLSYMTFVRGNKRDYDHWRDLGNPGWGYDDVLPYFIKLENNSIPGLQNSTYHGSDGYLSVERPRYRSPLLKYYLVAGHELGYDLVDYNGASQIGFSYTQNTLRDGLKCSTEKAFLRPVSRRGNLHISTESMVEKILINESTKATYGVKFRRGGMEHIVYINKEVVLSAGSVQSPQLLMLSGIGPKKHLEDVGVPVIHDAPGVGQNLQDHIAVGGLSYLYDAPKNKDSASFTVSKSSGIVSLSAIDQFLDLKNGSLYDFTGGEAHSFIHTGVSNSSLDHPDIQLIFVSAGDNMGAFVSKRSMNLKDDFADHLWKGITNNNSYQLVPTMLHPKSRGNITLRNADPNEAPVINANYLAEQADVDVLVKASQITYTISQTSAMQKLNPRLNPNLTPHCGSLNIFSYEFLECHARHYTFNLHHPCCTCKMGPANDFMAVVDSRLKVYGVTGLRVADASVMPSITSGNINGPTIMIGEKASDLIKEDNSLTPLHKNPSRCQSIFKRCKA